MRTSRAAALAAAIIVTAGVAGGYAVRRHGHAQPRPVAVVRSAAPLPSAPPPREPILAGLDATAEVPTTTGVAASLAGPARQVAQTAHLVGEVIDADTGERLWGRDPRQPEAPASTTKLFTAAAALTALGPDYRLTTVTRRIGHTVYLVGGGDPTIALSAKSDVSPSYPQPATLTDLAKQTAAALGGITQVRLRIDASAWSGPKLARGWKASYVTEGDVTPPSALELNEGRINPESPLAARTTTPAAQAGAAFAGLLAHDGITVKGPVLKGTAGPASTPLGSVSSPPVAQLVQRMLTVSDDDLAEALGRAVARHDRKIATFAAAGAAVRATVASLGVPVDGVSLQDTSGLSHLDRMTPRALVAVLQAATSPTRPVLRPILTGLPIAGLTGTLDDRFDEPPTSSAEGLLRAKTGTLTGVNALSGLVVDRSGRLLIFAFLASNAPEPGFTVPAIDRLAAKVARCGCT